MTVREASDMLQKADSTCLDTERHLQLQFWREWLRRGLLSDPLDERDGMTIASICEQVRREQEASNASGGIASR